MIHKIHMVLSEFSPNKILKEITERDNFGTSDVFGIFINGFNDGQQEYSFLLMQQMVKQIVCVPVKKEKIFLGMLSG